MPVRPLPRTATAPQSRPPWIDQRLKAVAEQRGGTVVDLIAELGGEEVRQNLVDILGSKLDHTLYHDVFLPAGGHHVVSSGPGMEVLKGEIDTAFAEGRWVGQMLCFVRQIEEHHPELRASLRKAWAIVAAERKHQDPNAGTDHSRFLQTAWPRKRCVGPLYAGLLIVLSLRGKVPGHMQPELTQDEVGEVVAYAMWLREWAANFKPFHSNGEPLINPFEAAEYDCPVSPIEPPLGQLSADRLKWLRQRAKRPKPVLHSRKRNVVSAEID